MQYQIIIDGEISRWGYSKQYFRQLLDTYKGKHVDMRISSPGGDLDHGLDIRSQIASHGDVTVYITGITASAATVVAMGAKKICMDKYALFMVHKCSNYIDVYGRYNADEIAKLIEELDANKRENDKVDVMLAQMYAERTGKKISDLMDLLKEGGWLTAEEALKWGFIDEIVESGTSQKLNYNDEMKQKFNAYSLPPLPDLHTNFDADHQSLSGLRDLIDKISSALKAMMPTRNTEPKKDSLQNTMPTEQPIYPAIMNALSVEKMTVNADGSIVLSQTQLESINAALTSNTQTIADRDKTIAALNDQVAALKQQPADDTTTVIDDGTTEEISVDDMYNQIEKFL